MWYYVTITRNGKTLYVISPAYNEFALCNERVITLFVWETEENARTDIRWHHLVQPGDKIAYHRTYS